MKKFWKRFLCVTLCALLLCGTAPLALPVGAADGYEAGDIIELGSYPQTRVDPTEYALINALSAQPQTWISYNYYYSESGVEPRLTHENYSQRKKGRRRGNRGHTHIFDACGKGSFSLKLGNF